MQTIYKSLKLIFIKELMKQKKVKTCEIQLKLWNNNAEECFKEVQIGKKMSLQNKASNFQQNF